MDDRALRALVRRAEASITGLAALVGVSDVRNVPAEMLKSVRSDGDRQRLPFELVPCFQGFCRTFALVAADSQPVREMRTALRQVRDPTPDE